LIEYVRVAFEIVVLENTTDLLNVTVLENLVVILTLEKKFPTVILLVVGEPAGSLTTMIRSSDVNVVIALSSEIFGIAPSI
jgi:hypothetical protein